MNTIIKRKQCWQIIGLSSLSLLFALLVTLNLFVRFLPSSMDIVVHGILFCSILALIYCAVSIFKTNWSTLETQAFQYDGLFEIENKGVLILDTELNIVAANTRFRQLINQHSDNLQGTNAADLPLNFDGLSLGDMPTLFHDHRNDLEPPSSNSLSSLRETTFWLENETQQRRRIKLEVQLQQNQQGKVAQYSLFFEDITELYLQQEKLEKSLKINNLTQINNRKKFEEDIRKTPASHGVSAIALIDIDGLRTINHQYGLQAGDIAISTAAKRLLKAIEMSPHQLYHARGDEFALILHECESANEAERYVRALGQFLRGEVKLNMSNFELSACIGLAIVEPDDSNFLNTFNNADIALIDAKQQGQRSIVVADELILNHHRIENDIVTSLRSLQLEEELQVAYLPKIDIQHNILVGAEALVRWSPKHQGLVNNDTFIKIAENTGEIKRIDSWVLQQAIKDAKRFNEQIYGFTTTVNVSPKSLVRPQFSRELLNQLQEAEVDPDTFSIEITEWTAISSYDQCAPNITQLRQNGVNVELDDFGTGYASMSNLAKLELDALKIDRSFINMMLTNSQCRAIVRSIIDLAHDFNMPVIAEGVDNHNQLKWLRSMGCDYCQGYLYSEPVIMESEESMRSAIDEWLHTIDVLKV